MLSLLEDKRNLRFETSLSVRPKGLPQQQGRYRNFGRRVPPERELLLPRYKATA